MKDKLKTLRSRIDAIDRRLVRLLNERTRYVLEIGKIKHALGEEIYAPEREDAVLRRVTANNKGPLRDDSLRAIYREIMSSALALEKPLTIAYLGPEATYSHMASVKKFGASLNYLPEPNISDVFMEVAKGRADYGVVPIENSTEGAVTHTYDMFIHSDLKICAEILLRICHNLMSAGERNQIRRLYSIPQVFAQCRQWLQLNMPNVEQIEVSSTSRAAQIAREDPTAGAIASELAAELYGLTIHDRHIQDSSENVTRFLVIGRKSPPRTGRDKTSIMFSVRDRVGALHDCIASFKKHNINMTKIESRPNRQKAWEYYFFVDFIGHSEDRRVKKALEELAKHAVLIKILGSYPRPHELPAT
ncbi:MAG: prephenate dehydratase [Verrucomicrobiae bacterium]|nr:prephenate dehydratase [Verrucomicrobiae bacterium]